MSDTEIVEEHQELQLKLKMFVEQARENEQKMRRFQEQELNLIGSRTLPDLLNSILYDYRRAFALDAVTLMLYDPEYEIRRILEEEGMRMEKHPGLLFLNSREQLINTMGQHLEPALGAYNNEHHRVYFNQPAHTFMPLCSVAILPLIRYGELIGSFNLGSFSEDRFTESTATDFLQRLATIVAICIENATNTERLKRVGLTDALTRVNNRRFFDQRITEEIGRSIRADEPISCLFIDIDHFKKINDEFGHQQGDAILRETAQRIRDQLRNCDVIARYGGEEFSAILTNTTEETAVDVAERIRTCIDYNPFPLLTDDEEINVTVSIGVATFSSLQGLEDVNKLGQVLVDYADHALYEAKSDGRNCVRLYEHGTEIEHLQIDAGLRR